VVTVLNSAGSLLAARLIRSLSAEEAVRVVSDANFDDDDDAAVCTYSRRLIFSSSEIVLASLNEKKMKN